MKSLRYRSGFFILPRQHRNLCGSAPPDQPARSFLTRYREKYPADLGARKPRISCPVAGGHQQQAAKSVAGVNCYRSAHRVESTRSTAFMNHQRQTAPGWLLTHCGAGEPLPQRRKITRQARGYSILPLPGYYSRRAVLSSRMVNKQRFTLPAGQRFVVTG